MSFMKRILLFALLNVVIIVTVSVILNLLGVQPYMTQYGLNYQSLAAFCLVWGMVGSFISLFISKWMAKWSMGVKIVDRDPQYASLVKMVHHYSKKAGIRKMPEVGVYQSPEINAFATGPSKNNSLVAVSTGLLQNMGSDEVEGVLGHEVAHIANGDMVTMTLLQGILNAFVMFFARIAAFFIDQFFRDEDSGRGGLGPFAHIFVVIIFEVLFGIVASIILCWFSRFREFKADSGGAKLAGREKMIKALEGLQRNFGVMKEVESHEASGHKSFSSFKISSGKGFLALFMSHPPLEKRIQALKRRSY